MKQLLFIFTIAISLLSCGSKDQTLTEAEFDRLLSRDSIESIKVLDNSQVKIIQKSISGKGKTYLLAIESADSFEASLNSLQGKLKAKNIHPSFSVYSVSGPTQSFYLMLLDPLFSLISFVLFLLTAIDVLKNRFESSIDKLIWFLVVLLPIVGPILYLSIGRKQRLTKC